MPQCPEVKRFKDSQGLKHNRPLVPRAAFEQGGIFKVERHRLFKIRFETSKIGSGKQASFLSGKFFNLQGRFPFVKSIKNSLKSLFTCTSLCFFLSLKILKQISQGRIENYLSDFGYLSIGNVYFSTVRPLVPKFFFEIPYAVSFLSIINLHAPESRFLRSQVPVLSHQQR